MNPIRPVNGPLTLHAQPALRPGVDFRIADSTRAASDWLLWQLADSAFPTGGFAHSSGLEAAWQHGEVRNELELVSFLEASLQQLGRASLPFAIVAYDEPERLEEFDRLCDAFTVNHVANRASRLQGRAFQSAVERIFTPTAHASTPEQVRLENNGRSSEPPCIETTTAEERHAPSPPCGHFAPVFGAVLRRFSIRRETTIRLFFFNHFRGVLAAAVRLNIVGPMAAQSIQYRLAPQADDLASNCANLSLDDLAQTAPLLDLWQGTHDRLYSRLFQS